MERRTGFPGRGKGHGADEVDAAGIERGALCVREIGRRCERCREKDMASMNADDEGEQPK